QWRAALGPRHRRAVGARRGAGARRGLNRQRPRPRERRVTDLPDLTALVAQLPADCLPEAIGQLAAAQARALARLTAPPQVSSVPSDGAALDVAEVARRTAMSRQWLYRQARAGHLPFARRIGRRLVFDPAGLARWLERRPR